jgi:lipopolysaccharide export system protein LptA
MILARNTALAVALAGFLVAGAGTPAFAQPAPSKRTAVTQPATTMPNALEGFARNRKDPIKIEATTLEVRDREKIAVFSGNVIVQQGETELRCKKLEVHYEGTAAAVQVKDGPGVSSQQIRKLVAVGGVIVTSKDQRATGDSGVYDAKANTVTLTGNVILIQGPNVMRGQRLVTDLTSGLSKLDAETKTSPGRVQGLFIPGTAKEPTQTQPAPPGSPPKPIPLPQRQTR